MNKKLQFGLNPKKILTLMLAATLMTGMVTPLGQGFSATLKSNTASTKLYTPRTSF